MAHYDWTYQTVGGNTRVVITKGEDIRHLGELDQKMWTILSCPTTGLEIADSTLQLMDTDGDGKIRVHEVVATSEWLCSVLRDPDLLLEGTDSISTTDLNLENAEGQQIAGVVKLLAGEKDSICLADVLSAVGIISDSIAAAEVKALPAAPFDGGIVSAFRGKKADFDKYFEDLRLEELGLASTDPETAPKIKQAFYEELCEKIGAFDAEVATIEADNKAAADARAAAIVAATAEYQPLIKLLRLKKDFYTLLKNYVCLQDFYADDQKAIFQCGTLIIDQRACDLCLRVMNPGDMGTFASLSGMYLIFCDCVNKSQGKTMSIVAAMTVGDINDLFVGKNAIFYDRSGLDYDAKVTKIIDNPISIQQAFWSPYKKFGKWIKDLINKSATEKETQGFEDMKAKATTSIEAGKEGDATAKAQPFDIAKFAGIFAAIGMALGFIGSFFVSLGNGIAQLNWWQFILVVVGVLLCISGPSMLLAYLKLRDRNLSPVLNANGWAVNAKSKISVRFGVTLTHAAKFPVLPDQKKQPCWLRWLIGVVAAAIVVVVLWLCGCFKFIGCGGPFVHEEPAAVEEVAEAADAETAAVEEVAVAAEEVAE